MQQGSGLRTSQKAPWAGIRSTVLPAHWHSVRCLGCSSVQQGPPTRRSRGDFVRVASNIGPDGGGFEYALAQELLPDFNFEAQRVVWGTQLDGDARTLLCEIEDEGDFAATNGKMKEASTWLCDALASGPVAVVELEVDAKAEGIAWRTVKRAKRANAIVATKDGEAGSWRWRLPE